jgi:hypothetical protein
MKVLNTSIINDTIKDSLKKAMSYQEYRNLISDLVEKKSTTGNEKTEGLANYTLLNNKRMNRWDKTLKVTEKDKKTIESFNRKVTWLVISESWCGDAAHIMPVIHKIAELNSNIDYKIVLRDDNEVLMHQFLTNGGKSIPKLIMIDNETDNILSTFGPRPTVATQMVNTYKAEHGQLSPTFKEELQHWYNKDKGQSTIADLINLLN